MIRPAAVGSRFAGEAGYSLIELLVVLIIIGTVLGALVTVFTSGSNAEANLNNRFQAQLQARLALDQLRQEVHCASALMNASTSSITLTLPTPTNGAQPCPTGTGSFTWRTCPVTATRWRLYRIPGMNAACGAAGAKQEADYLVPTVGFPAPTPFPAPTYFQPTATTLGRLNVELDVNVTPAKPGTYTLTDAIVLHNSG